MSKHMFSIASSVEFICMLILGAWSSSGMWCQASIIRSVVYELGALIFIGTFAFASAGLLQAMVDKLKPHFTAQDC